MNKRTILGQPSWRLATGDVEAYVTQTGGQVGPVTFDRRGRKIQPLSVAPWATEKLEPGTPPIIKVLRGDFFCMPFGGNGTPFRGERHPVHGEVANARWKRVDGDESSLHLRLRTRVRRGQVDKYVSIGDGNVVYQRHVISDMTGPMDFGHHVMIKFPDPPGSGVISTSPFKLGQVLPFPTEQPESRGYSILKPGAEFRTLDRVPTITGETADLSHYPARRGFEDIAMIVADESSPFAWTAVTFPKQRYVWFSLKDPRVLRGTIFWISNGGRHYPPWNGRHVNVLGLEDVTAYFHLGLAESAAPNPFSKRGVPTHVKLDANTPFTVSYIFGIAPIPAGFDRVARIEADVGGVALLTDSGKRANVRVDLASLA